jgi:hypothetical protein
VVASGNDQNRTRWMSHQGADDRAEYRGRASVSALTQHQHRRVLARSTQFAFSVALDHLNGDSNRRLAGLLPGRLQLLRFLGKSLPDELPGLAPPAS